MVRRILVARAAWIERMAELALTERPLSGLKRRSAQWLRPELRVRVKHLKAKGVLYEDDGLVNNSRALKHLRAMPP
jgi:hypothetical protein